MLTADFPSQDKLQSLNDKNTSPLNEVSPRIISDNFTEFANENFKLKILTDVMIPFDTSGIMSNFKEMFWIFMSYV